MTRLLPNIGRVLLTVLFVVGAIIALLLVWQHYQDDPWTRDGSVQADVVQVTADVSGMVSEVLVHDNEFVHAGDAIFSIDRERFAAQLAQSDASVSLSQASIKSALAKVASEEAALGNAIRERDRYVPLGDLVSDEQRDQRETTVKQDRASLAEAQASLEEARASLRGAEANRRTSQINLERATVRAGVTGYITQFTLLPGDYVTSGISLFALLDANSLYVVAYLEETKMHRFDVGDRVRIELLGDSRTLWGRVHSIAAGITDRQKSPSTEQLPNITPTFSWIRLAQRIPVRISIDAVPVDLRLIAGRTATVTILPGSRPLQTRPALPANPGAPNNPTAPGGPNAPNAPIASSGMVRPRTEHGL